MKTTALVLSTVTYISIHKLEIMTEYRKDNQNPG